MTQLATQDPFTTFGQLLGEHMVVEMVDWHTDGRVDWNTGKVHYVDLAHLRGELKGPVFGVDRSEVFAGFAASFAHVLAILEAAGAAHDQPPTWRVSGCVDPSSGLLGARRVVGWRADVDLYLLAGGGVSG